MVNNYGNLSRLRYFRAVCENGTMTKAAEVISISQPSLTLSIKELEKELGISLFHRTQNTVTLTKQGEYVYKIVCDILDMFDENYKKIIEYGERAGKEVAIGIPPVLGTIIIPTIVSDLDKEHEEIEIKIIESTTVQAMEMLDKNTLDLAVFICDDAPSKYNYQTIGSTEIGYWVHKSHPMANREYITEEEVCQFPLISLPTKSFHYKAVSQRFESLGLDLSIKMSTEQLYTIFKTIEKTNSGTIIFKDVKAPSDDFVCIRFKEPIKGSYAVVWKKNSYMTSSQKKVLKLLTKNVELNQLAKE